MGWQHLSSSSSECLLSLSKRSPRQTCLLCFSEMIVTHHHMTRTCTFDTQQGTSVSGTTLSKMWSSHQILHPQNTYPSLVYVSDGGSRGILRSRFSSSFGHGNEDIQPFKWHRPYHSTWGNTDSVWGWKSSTHYTQWGMLVWHTSSFIRIRKHPGTIFNIFSR